MTISCHEIRTFAEWSHLWLGLCAYCRDMMGHVISEAPASWEKLRQAKLTPHDSVINMCLGARGAQEMVLPATPKRIAEAEDGSKTRCLSSYVWKKSWGVDLESPWTPSASYIPKAETREVEWQTHSWDLVKLRIMSSTSLLSSNPASVEYCTWVYY